MSNSANETVKCPFSSFNFSVEISVPGVSRKVCSAAFAECDGLEMNMEVKTIREGGNNGTQIRLVGPTSYGQLTLRRGMTATFDLWDWFTATMNNARLRADAEVVLLAENGTTERARFILKRCIPVKVKAPAMNAKDGAVAIEELQLAYESLKLKRPGGGGAGLSFGVSAGLSVGAEASLSVDASLEASASIDAGASVGAEASFGVEASAGANFSIG
jgi:phage tail-like protein